MKYRDLIKTFDKKLEESSVIDENSLREDYVEEKIFNVGDIVKTNDGQIAEIIDRGPNYLTLIREGKTFKKWLRDVTPVQVEESNKRDSQIYKESFIIKGYKTKNFTREISEKFKELSRNEDDAYALYNSVICVDKLLECLGDSTLCEDNFNDYRVSFDRATRYLNKFEIVIDEISQIEDKLLMYALKEEQRFSVMDQTKIATVIASAAGCSTEGTPVNIVNRAARKFKVGTHSKDVWKIVGQMLKKADQANIKWDKNIFAKTTLRYMGL